MNVEVTLNDGTVIYPSYAPEHLNEVVGFYQQKYWANEIQGYRVTLDNGNLFAIGSVNGSL